MSELDPHAETLRAALAGDREAARKLCIAIAPAMLSTLRRILGAHPDVEDLLQECFVTFIERLPTYRHEAPIVHFGRGIAVHKAQEAIRRRRVSLRSLDRVGAAATAAESGVERQDVPHRALLAERIRAALSRLIGSLNNAQAEAILLQSTGHSIEEIAAAAGIPVNTARSRLQTAKRELRLKMLSEPELRALVEEDA